MQAFLSLGSNVGDRPLNLARAREMIARQCGTIVSASSIYETEPVDYLDQPAFLNQVLEIEPRLAADELLKTCLAIELSLGRIRDVAKGPRTIDIDVLLYDQQVVNIEEPISLTIPHPRMHQRRFVLEPLAEIAPNLIHPIFGQSIRHLLEKLEDQAGV